LFTRAYRNQALKFVPKRRSIFVASFLRKQSIESSKVIMSRKLQPEDLRRHTKLPQKGAVLPELDPFLGQDRARDAVELAMSIEANGFNLFVAAPRGAQVRPLLLEHLRSDAKHQAPPSDWAYVYNFDQPHIPQAVELPAGQAGVFHKAMLELVRDLKDAIPAAFEKPDVQTRRRALEDDFRDKQENAFEALGNEAREQDVAILRGPMGFTLAPLDENEVMKPDALQALSKKEQEERQAAVSEIQQKLEEIVRTIPKWEQELRTQMRALERETIEAAITQSIKDAKRTLKSVPAALDHLDAVKKDLIENVDIFSAATLASSDTPAPGPDADVAADPFERYDINVFVERGGGDAGAPVIEEVNPTLAHLVGRVEHRAEGGYLTTSFKLIKPGALHRANGGYLLLDARNLLTEPMSWRALKRTLQSGCIKTESLSEALNLTSTITLEPQPIPLTAKIILLGDAWIYHILTTYDPEFSNYFKLLADFEGDMPRNLETEAQLGAWIENLASRHELFPPERGAVERLIDEAARDAGNANRLSLSGDDMLDAMSEAHYYARGKKRRSIKRVDVDRALDAIRHRTGRIGKRMQDQLLNGVSLVDTEGARIGQINGLSVFEFGGSRFGKPNRITASTRPGSGRIIDIERESQLGGPIHSKGVLILSGYLAGRYAMDNSLSLSASIVLEQSYGGVEGDSASLAELIATLSSIAQQPIYQGLAITGAVNQLGDVQAIGGVNEKIEGFYDLCEARGLTGKQGVLIPKSNAQHLMLRSDIVSACKAGRFSVHTVATIDEAIPLLLGVSASELHASVEASLARYGKALQTAPAAVLNITDEKVGETPPAEWPPGRPPETPPDTPPRQPPKAGLSGCKSP
jgi:predicted ATP-dependent protease